jgi:RimJ/RimL family protein N-acetyltransferase
MESGGALVALDRGSGAVIGSSRYHGYDPEKREVEVGWTFLARRYWGGSYNGEMKRLMLDHAFASVDRVLFRIGLENRRSRRAVEKIGAGFLQQVRDAQGRDGVVYALTREQYAHGPLATAG